MSLEDLKTLALRSQTFVQWYSKWIFPLTIPKKEFADRPKIDLILAAKPYTMLSYPRLSKLYETARQLEREGLPGSFVECGAWNGGSAALLAKVAERNQNRHIWLFDSWEGLPEPSPEDVSYRGDPGKKAMILGSEEKARELIFKKFRLNPHNVHLVKGWFKDTIPSHKPAMGEIALLHIDCDWYESVKLCLRELYDRVVRNGFIFIDDYGYWKGCKKAVEEFIRERNLKIELIQIDFTGVYFQK